MFFRVLIWDTVTNERPAAYSLLPRSITAFGSVSSWLLCTVIAHARVRGICKREHATVLSIRTAIRREGRSWFSWKSISSTVPTESLTNPVSTDKLALSITCVLLDNNNWASRPFAVSESA
ncbi:hypothetical protein RCL_jg11932.t1 [Rhizophagus clarus]|uniref:Uncharacterized protein n=1 Tax=Rhizophagus clarus TaxID=94130 RepID=A0A8H3L8P2_9GLOM|nr:hypothetical protein RCL_jg11932.t1 [Rhizophagus clarus]